MALVTSGPCGGIGGSPFCSPMDPKINLLAVRVWAREDCIAAMQIQYELNGQISESDVWGDNQQPATFYEVVVNVTQGEFMRSISGTVGKISDGLVIVTSISFTTSVTTYGPFGNTSDAAAHPFNIEAGNEEKIAGFFGYSGYLLDAIGVLVKQNTVPVKEGPCGGAGGDVFTMDINDDTNLLGVNIWYRSDCIAAIQVNYQISGQGDIWSNIWGDGSGATLSEISFGGQSLKSISGYMGYGDWGIFVVKALSFVTDDGATYGPFGNEGGAPFAFETGTVGKIVGFHGRSGSLLDAIGVIMLN